MKRLSLRHELALDLRARGLDATGIARALETTDVTARRLLAEADALRDRQQHRALVTLRGGL